MMRMRSKRRGRKRLKKKGSVLQHPLQRMLGKLKRNSAVDGESQEMLSIITKKIKDLHW